MGKIEKWLNHEFESSYRVTSEFLEFVKDYKNEVKRQLPPGWEIVSWDTGHFECSAFLRNKDNKYIYISCHDVRYGQNEWYNNILIRSAAGPRDYTGGSNGYTELKNLRSKILSLENFIDPSDEVPPQKPNLKTILKKIKACNTIEDLENLGIGSLYVDISHRGGGLGFYANAISNFFDIDMLLLPGKIGVFCDYLGGGIRGRIQKGSFSDKIEGIKRVILNELINACYRAYENAENELGMNNETYEDGETNWNAVATNQIRNR